jgi:hypothetical protein
VRARGYVPEQVWRVRGGVALDHLPARAASSAPARRPAGGTAGRRALVRGRYLLIRTVRSIESLPQMKRSLVT